MADSQNSNCDVLVWYVRHAEFDVHLLREISRRDLATDEFERADQFRFERDKRSFLAGRLLTRWQLAGLCETTADQLRFETNRFGKPHLSFPVDAHIHFSRSRTKEMAAVAVADDSAIGLDIEPIDPTVEVNSIADQFLAPTEVDQLQQSPAAMRQELFFRFWTLKEAYVKARGEGLSIPLDRFAFDLSEGTPRISFPGLLDDDPDCWQFVESTLDQHHRAAVALRRDSTSQCHVEWIDKTQELAAMAFR